MVPLYRVVHARVLDGLARGEWKPGDRLPSESELARRFGVAVFTIRAGISELVVANVLVRKQGKGTFVASHAHTRAPFTYMRVYHNSGAKLVAQRSLLSMKKERADAETVARLQLDRGRSQRVYRMVFLLSTERGPVAVHDVAVPVAMIRGLKRAPLRTQDNLYAIYQDHGIYVVRREEQVRAVKASAAVAHALGIKPGVPVLEVRRVAYTYDGKPVEFLIRSFEATQHYYSWNQAGNST